MAKQVERVKNASEGTEKAPEAANLSLPSLGDLKEYLQKADRILELLSKLIEMWSAVDPNRALAPRKRGDDNETPDTPGPVIPNPPSSGRAHLESNNGTIGWAGYP